MEFLQGGISCCADPAVRSNQDVYPRPLRDDGFCSGRVRPIDYYKDLVRWFGLVQYGIDASSKILGVGEHRNCDRNREVGAK